MSPITKEWLQQKIADMEAIRDDIPFGLGEDGANTLAALRIALASLEAEAAITVGDDGGDALAYRRLIQTFAPGTKLYTAPPAPANSEPVAWLWSHRKHPSEVTLVRPEDDERAEGDYWSGWSCHALYAAQPEPVSVPDYHDVLPCPVMLEPGLRFGKGVPTRTMLGALQRRAEYYAELEAMTPEQRAEHDAGMNEFAAMLQGAEPVSNRDELPLDYLQGHKDGLEWAAQLAEANRKGPDMPEADGNSPVIPDGWVMVPAEPTAEMLQSGISAHYERSQIQIHDRPAPGPMECAYMAMIAAAPQQEVK